MTARRTAALLTTLTIILAGCGGKPDLEDPPTLPPIDPAGIADDQSLATAAKAMTDFGYRLYQASADPAGNAVLSPFSIATAFGMARAGAGGTTGAELDTVFGFPPEGPHAAFNKLIRAADNTPGPPPESERGKSREPGQQAQPVVNVANGMFVQHGFQVKDTYTATLGTQYGARAYAVDFGKDGAETIDAWASEQTAGRIKKVFDQLDPATKVVLANAVYLKADWKNPFQDTATADGSFRRADGSSVPAKMMKQQAGLRYAAGAGWQAVELPYAGDQLAMWIIVPTGDTAPTGLLAPDTLAAVAGGLRPSFVDLTMPRWDFGAGLDLKQQLQSLGVRAAFGPGADFSGMADGLFISEAVHRANITVDEWGTEAAAVTAMASNTSAVAGSEVTVRADHPFAFAIMHSATGTPLFMGHVADPTAT